MLYIFEIVSVLTFLKIVLLIVPINCKNFANSLTCILKYCTFLGVVFTFGILSNSRAYGIILDGTTVSLLLIPIYSLTPDKIDQQIDLKTRHTKEKREVTC